MSSMSKDSLFTFQVRAASNLAIMLQEYPSDRFIKKYDPYTRRLMPFLCRLSAITGAGKTPILAYMASLLPPSVILWTTPRGAVVSQTLANLQGRYRDLLPPDTTIKQLGSLTDGDWEEMVNATPGLTIFVATVASFNQAGDKLKIHQPYGSSTRWKVLGDEGEGGRKRPLYVFYDEGHNATTEQFDRLRELNPRAFVLASASSLPEDLSDLLPDRQQGDREAALKERTVVVPTKDVVEAGLLKQRLYFMECDIAQADAVSEAQAKWLALVTKLKPLGHMPIACFVVNETTRGLDVWQHLIDVGVSPTQIAVHLNGAADVMRERHGSLKGLVDTYSGKRPEDRSPDMLKGNGYTHIIWNLTLREGWDEPFAYVGYIDAQGRSETDMVQKIGRFVRQPDARPFDDPDLNAAYFYFRASDDEFTNLIKRTQAEMEISGYDVIRTSSRNTPASRTADVIRPQTAPVLSPTFGEDPEALDKIVLDNISLFAEEDRRAVGSIETRVIDMNSLEEDKEQRSKVEREGNDTITVWKYLKARLSYIDSRIISDIGSIFTPNLEKHKRLMQEIQYNSHAMGDVERSIGTIRAGLDQRLEIEEEDAEYDIYNVKPFNLVSPNITGVTDTLREKYKVRDDYENAVHTAYNGLNAFERKVAEALDSLGKPWCRNPVGEGYFRIPIPQLGADDIWFYPDFLLWTNKEIWALDPKGKHIREAAVQNKLLDLPTSGRITLPVKIALILEGTYVHDAQQKLSKDTKDGFTLVKRGRSEVKVVPCKSVIKMVEALVGR